jgi:hypothetical protein
MNVYGSMMLAQASLPRLTIAQRVVDKIARNAAIYATETGESLVGFSIKQLGRPEPDLYIIDTIAPDDSAIRRGAYFEQGDDLQGDIFNWLSDNWKLIRKAKHLPDGSALDSKWDIDLENLGDWHKHPGTLIEPSYGDSQTAREHITDTQAGIPQLVAILATVWSKTSSDSYEATYNGDGSLVPVKPIKVPISDNELVRIDCWYMSRRTRRFVRLVPTVIENDKLPTLPAVAWTLNQVDRSAKELQALTAAGYSVAVEQQKINDQPPIKVCITLAKSNSSKALIVVTDPDYPATRPTIRTTPLSVIKGLSEDADMTQELWNKSEPLSPSSYPDWSWTSDKTILDLVRAVESKLTEGSAVS